MSDFINNLGKEISKFVGKALFNFIVGQKIQISTDDFIVELTVTSIKERKKDKEAPDGV